MPDNHSAVAPVASIRDAIFICISPLRSFIIPFRRSERAARLSRLFITTHTLSRDLDRDIVMGL
jgi:hypothetical protein